MSVVKDDDFIFIERCISSIKSKYSIKENLTKIESILNRIFNIETHITIIPNSTETFFGMNIYPAVDTMDCLIDNIVSDQRDTNKVYEIWNNNNKWFIEIDEMLLSDYQLNANPPEVVALLLHEIAAVIYSNNTPLRIHRLLSKKIIKFNYAMRQLLESEKIRKIFSIAIIESCSINNFSYTDTDVNADINKFVIDKGYADDFNSFVGKIIKKFGMGMINKTDDEINNDIEAIINWSIVNVTELEARKKRLRHDLKVELLKTQSEYIKRVIQDVYISFFGDATDKYRELLSEQYMSVPTDKYQEAMSEQILVEFANRILTEAGSNIFDKNGRLKKITQGDIDILTVEAERIENVDDKIYLLDKLYRMNDLITIGLDYIESGDEKKNPRVTQSKSTLLNMRTQLERLRDQILAVKIIDKDYGVFIRYPKGYQG